MTSSNLLIAPAHLVKRRQLLIATALGLSTTFLPPALRAQSTINELLRPASAAEVKAILDDFTQGQSPITTGLKLDMPVLGDNPAAVPVKVVFDESITPENFCEELIILAESNPKPLACRFQFTALAGTTEVAVRLRLIESQNIRALARMNDGRILMAQRHITVTAGGCGM